MQYPDDVVGQVARVEKEYSSIQGLQAGESYILLVLCASG